MNQMKKIVCGWALLSVLLTSCLSPIDDRESMDAPLPESAIDVDIHNITPGSNKIVMINNTPETASYWDYIIGYSTRRNDTILLPFLGQQTINFAVISGGGPTMLSRTINVEQIDFPTNPMWGYLAGSGTEGVTWVWAADIPSGYIYGNGEMDAMEPEWWQVDADEMNEWGNLYDEMKFDLNGGPNYTLTRKGTDGEGAPEVTKDKFILNTTKATLATTNSTPFIIDHGVFTIMKLNENEMILNIAMDDDGDGVPDTGYISMFKRKGFVY